MFNPDSFKCELNAYKNLFPLLQMQPLIFRLPHLCLWFFSLQSQFLSPVQVSVWLRAQCGQTDKALKEGLVPWLPWLFVQSGAAMYLLRKSTFQLARKAIVDLSWPGCALGVSGLPAGPGGVHWGVGWPSLGWVVGKSKAAGQWKRGEREDWEKGGRVWGMDVRWERWERTNKQRWWWGSEVN